MFKNLLKYLRKKWVREGKSLRVFNSFYFGKLIQDKKISKLKEFKRFFKNERQKSCFSNFFLEKLFGCENFLKDAFEFIQSGVLEK